MDHLLSRRQAQTLATSFGRWLSLSPPVRSVRRQVALRRRIYVPIRRWRRPDAVVSGKTDLVVEGFPRSGNTWLEAALRLASRDELCLAHHTHAAAHVHEAIELGRPVVVLFRNPCDAVASLLALTGGRSSARQAFADYVSFYESTWPLRGSTVSFLSFEDVTSRTSSSLALLDSRFDLRLCVPDVTTEEFRKAIFDGMDRKATQLGVQAGRSRSRPVESGYLSDGRRAAETAVSDSDMAKVRNRAMLVFSAMRSDLEGSP